MTGNSHSEAPEGVILPFLVRVEYVLEVLDKVPLDPVVVFGAQ
jgi:hypothetical protein